MITKSNRLDVVSTILRMHRDAEQFSGFSMAQGAADDLRIDDEKKAMERWMRVLSKSFDKDFRQLAELLGYRVENIEPVEPAAADQAVHEVFRPILDAFVKGVTL